MKTMQKQPSTVSPRETDFMLEKMPGITLMKDEPENFNPRIVLICEKITVVAAAEQKPEITGPDIKSTRKPLKNFVFEISFQSIKLIFTQVQNSSK